MKKISFITIVLALSLVFTACSTTNETKLYNAFLKTQDITSMESEGTINLSLELKDFPEETQEQLEEINNLLKNLKFNINTKQNINKDKTKSMVEMTTAMDFNGMKMDMNTWVDTDFSTDTPKMIAVLKMPQILMNELPSEDGSNKEYILYDYIKMLNLSQEEINMEELIKSSKDINEKAIEFMKNYHKDFDPGFQIATYKGQKTQDKDVLSIYEVKLDDKNFKSLIKYMGNDSIENENNIKFFEEYMKLVLNIAEISETEKVEALAELNNLKKNLPEFKNKFNEFMDTLEDVKILGDEGIVIEYAVNKDGYIVGEKGKIAIELDLKALGKVFEEELLVEDTGKLKLNIDFNTKISKINEKVEINMPKTNKENTIDFNELLETNVEQIEEAVE